MVQDRHTLYKSLEFKLLNSDMKTFIENLLTWADQNNMQLNRPTFKTKETIRSTLSRSKLQFLSTAVGTVDKVSSFKLLWVHIKFTICWSLHVDSMVKKLLKDYTN